MLLDDLLKDLKMPEQIGKKIRKSQRIGDFCNTFMSLSWKMMVQTPPMHFDNGDVGNPAGKLWYFGDDYNVLFIIQALHPSTRQQ